MTSDRGMRVSDRERECTAEVLRDAYTAGRLDLDEFQERAGAAYAAKTRGELFDLTADLPMDGEPYSDVDLYRRPGRPPAPLWPMGIVAVAMVAATRVAAVVVPFILLLLLGGLLTLRTTWRRARPGDGHSDLATTWRHRSDDVIRRRR